MVFIACETEKKLNTMKITVMILGTIFVNPWLNFKVIVKQISKNPARSKNIHAVDIKTLHFLEALMSYSSDLKIN